MRLPDSAYRRALRQHATAAERALWSILRDRRLGGFKFRRQHHLGSFVVDAYCHSARLAVELDGSVHDDPARAAYDAERQQKIEALGVAVLRLRNDDVTERPEVAASAILEACRGRGASSSG